MCSVIIGEYIWKLLLAKVFWATHICVNSSSCIVTCPVDIAKMLKTVFTSSIFLQKALPYITQLSSILTASRIAANILSLGKGISFSPQTGSQKMLLTVFVALTACLSTRKLCTSPSRSPVFFAPNPNLFQLGTQSSDLRQLPARHTIT